MSGAQLPCDLGRRVDGRIDRSEDPAFGFLQCRCELREPDIADDHQIDVTRRVLVLACHRAVNEGHLNPIPEPRQIFGEDILEPRRPEQQPPQVAEDRVVGLGPVVSPVPVRSPPQDSRASTRLASLRWRLDGETPICRTRSLKYHSRLVSISRAARMAWRVFGNNASRTFLLRILRKNTSKTRRRQDEKELPHGTGFRPALVVPGAGPVQSLSRTRTAGRRSGEHRHATAPEDPILDGGDHDVRPDDGRGPRFCSSRSMIMSTASRGAGSCTVQRLFFLAIRLTALALGSWKEHSAGADHDAGDAGLRRLPLADLDRRGRSTRARSGTGAGDDRCHGNDPHLPDGSSTGLPRVRGGIGEEDVRGGLLPYLTIMLVTAGLSIAIAVPRFRLELPAVGPLRPPPRRRGSFPSRRRCSRRGHGAQRLPAARDDADDAVVLEHRVPGPIIRRPAARSPACRDHVPWPCPWTRRPARPRRARRPRSTRCTG